MLTTLPQPSRGLSVVVTFNLHPISLLSPRQSKTLEQQLLPAVSGKAGDLGRRRLVCREHPSSQSMQDPLPLTYPFLLNSVTCLSVLPFVSALKAETPAQTKLRGKGCN